MIELEILLSDETLGPYFKSFGAGHLQVLDALNGAFPWLAGPSRRQKQPQQS